MAYSPKLQEASLLVPTALQHDHIAARSVIVAGEPDEDRWVVYYEGAIYGQPDDFQSKLSIAAGRLAHKGPTSAILSAPKSDFVPAAKVMWSTRYHCWIISTILRPELLTQWFEDDSLAVGPTDLQRQWRAGMIFSEHRNAIIEFERARMSGLDPIEAIVDMYG